MSETRNPFSLTDVQEQVLMSIASGSTISEAAAAAGVHRNTVHNWMQIPRFSGALEGVRDVRASQWRDQAEKHVAAAIETIVAVMSDAKTSPSVRLRAAQFILNLAMTQPARISHKDVPLIPESVPNSAQPASGRTGGLAAAQTHNSAQPSRCSASGLAAGQTHNSAQSGAVA